MKESAMKEFRDTPNHKRPLFRARQVKSLSFIPMADLNKELIVSNNKLKKSIFHIGTIMEKLGAN